jgi:hypothetical protein
MNSPCQDICNRCLCPQGYPQAETRLGIFGRHPAKADQGEGLPCAAPDTDHVPSVEVAARDTDPLVHPEPRQRVVHFEGVRVGMQQARSALARAAFVLSAVLTRPG